MTRRLARFGVSGVAVTAVHACLVLALVHWLDQPQAAANGVAFVGATVVSYFLNTLWTFGATINRSNVARYGGVTLLGLAWSSWLGHLADRFGWLPIMTIIATLLTAPPMVFFLHARWTYASGSTRP